MAKTIDVAGTMQVLNQEIREFMVTGMSYPEAVHAENNIYARLLADYIAYDYSINERWIQRYKVLDELENHIRRVR